ncbi:methyltransferase domain-containing protein [Actinospongicola halichondriae]|uniref:methyltransferase domain-containing protein n=1 Tax=Actinospongicola halichondriae TaxID=3236844 RepID=UPI003D532F39
MNMSDDTWDPAQYERFRAERERPLHDLVTLLHPSPGGDVADLGCGTGRYTPLVHAHVDARRTTGYDTSERMLDQSADFASEDIHFERRDIVDLSGQWDVLFANASLQWLPDHERLVPDLVEHLRPGGQLAFQVPANFGHPSHTVADDVGREFGLDPLDRAIGAIAPARYAEILWSAGLRDLDVSLRIYGVDMACTDDVIEWVSGSLLTRFESRLTPPRFEEFRAAYRTRLLDELGDPEGSSPYFYAFPRILCWGRLPS